MKAKTINEISRDVIYIISQGKINMNQAERIMIKFGKKYAEQYWEGKNKESSKKRNCQNCYHIQHSGESYPCTECKNMNFWYPTKTKKQT